MPSNLYPMLFPGSVQQLRISGYLCLRFFPRSVVSDALTDSKVGSLSIYLIRIFLLMARTMRRPESDREVIWLAFLVGWLFVFRNG